MKEKIRRVRKNSPIKKDDNGELKIDTQDNCESLEAETKSDIAPARAKALPDDKKFGNYILVKELGAGGMGTVYKAYHSTLQSYFALKMIQPDKVGKEGVSRLEREARAAFKLRHPNIVQVHDTGIQDNKHYIVMDYIEGKDLGHLIEQKKFLPRNALELVLQIARALEYSHKEGIVHRDIKPSNILLIQREGKATPYLVDFGLASVVKEEKLTRSGEILGTPVYMSPEQAMAMKGIDGRTDVYSLGTVLYEMLSGKTAFKGPHVAMILYNVVSKEPELLTNLVPGISKEVEAIVMKCLEKERERRYQSAAELADDIERYIRGEAVLATSPTPLSRAWKNIKRNRKFLAVITAAALLLIGVVGLWGLSHYKQARETKKAREETEKAKAETEKAREEVEKTKQEAIQALRDKIKDTWLKVNQEESKGNFDTALALCNKLIDLDPNDGRFSKKVIEITQKKESQRKEARKYYDEAMEMFRDPGLEEKDLENCLSLFEDAIKADTSYADAHFQAGRAAHRLFKTDEARKHYNESKYLDKTLTAPNYYLTVLELPPIIHQIISGKAGEKQLDQKFNEIWSVESPNIKTDDTYLLLAKAQYLLLRKDKWDECRKLCDQIIKQKSFTDAYLIRAQVNSYPILYDEKSTFKEVMVQDAPKDLDQAIKDCTRCISLDPFRFEGYALRGAIYQSIGAYECAERDYTRALIIKNLNSPWSYIKRAFCYVAMGIVDPALEDFEKSIEYLENKAESKVETQASVFSYKVILKACSKDRQAEEFLNNYISIRPQKFSASDEFLKTLTYIFIDDQTHRAEQSFRSFLQDNKDSFKPFQLLTMSILKGKSSDSFVQAATISLKWGSNLFCAPPIFKNFRLLDSLNNMPLGTGQENWFYIWLRRALEELNNVSRGDEKLRKINLIFKEECPPLTLDFIVYFSNYLSEDSKIQKTINLNELPSASLYYRRAVSFYIRREYEKAIKDLYSALELESGFMEAHYGLSTLYSLLSAKDKDKASEYREKALDHLKQAVDSGWSHIKDYTLKDDEFSVLGLGKTVPMDEVNSWDKKRQEKEREIKEFSQKVERLIASGNPLQALKLLYKSEYSYKLKALTTHAERKAIKYSSDALEKEKEEDLEHKIDLALGERGKIILEWAKKEKDYKQKKKR